MIEMRKDVMLACLQGGNRKKKDEDKEKKRKKRTRLKRIRLNEKKKMNSRHTIYISLSYTSMYLIYTRQRKLKYSNYVPLIRRKREMRRANLETGTVVFICSSFKPGPNRTRFFECSCFISRIYYIGQLLRRSKTRNKVKKLPVLHDEHWFPQL